MSRIKVETYQVGCDGCGELFTTYDGFTCYTDCPNAIEDEASASGWVFTSDGHHYCPSCHEWNDDDILVCMDGKKYDEDYEPIVEE